MSVGPWELVLGLGCLLVILAAVGGTIALVWFVMKNRNGRPGGGD